MSFDSGPLLPRPLAALLRPSSIGYALMLGLLALVVSWPALQVGMDTAPWYQGFDEPSKARQILTGSYKYNHPPTMVASARVLGQAHGELANREDAVHWGREVIVLCSALAVAVLAAFAALRRGPLAALLLTLLLLCLDHLQYNARVVKEEPMLLAGCALVILAVAWRQQNRSSTSAALLGVAGVLATAGKYLGVVALLAGLVALLFLPGARGRGRDLLWWLLGLAACALLVLAPVWLNLGPTLAGLQREFAHMTDTGPAVDDTAWFNPRAAIVYAEEMTRGETILALIGILALVWRSRRKPDAGEITLVALGLTLLLVVMFSNFYSSRYQLVPRALSAYLVVLGILGLIQGSLHLTRRAHQPWLRFVPAALATIGCAVFLRDQIKQLPEIYRDVTTNHRQELLDWAQAELPKDAVLLADRYSRMPSPDHVNLKYAKQPLAEPIHLSEQDPALLDPVDIRRWHANYIILTRQSLGRYYKKIRDQKLADLSPKDRRRRRFYDHILESDPLWEQRFRGHHHLYSPGLEVYPLPESAIQALEGTSENPYGRADQ